jgi:hypothetical protein
VSLENPFAMHKQAFWASHAGNANLALWMRVYAAAYGLHRRNGHAPFKPGDLIIATSIVDKETGEVKAPRTDEISRAIRAAIENGFLSPLSNSRCLVVPTWAISGGVLGRPSQVCKLHGRCS